MVFYRNKDTGILIIYQTDKIYNNIYVIYILKTKFFISDRCKFNSNQFFN